MPSSLIIGALVLAWLVVLVPMIARRRQEVTRPTESALAARVVRSGNARREHEKDGVMADSAAQESEYYPRERDDYYEDEVEYREYDDRDYAESPDQDYAERPEYYDDREHAYRDGDYEDDEQLTDELPIPEEEQPYQRRKPAPLRARPYRPGRGGFNPEAAELAKQAKYAFRRRVVLAMVIAAVGTLVGAAVVLPMLWWAHGAVDLALAGYLAYLRRQVHIEEEVRQRRLARVRTVREAERAAGHGALARPEQAQRPSPKPRATPQTPPPAPPAGTAVVDVDDDDPAFDELDEPDVLPYRRAAGE